MYVLLFGVSYSLMFHSDDLLSIHLHSTVFISDQRDQCFHDDDDDDDDDDDLCFFLSYS